MPVIERYRHAAEIEPRSCQHSDPSDKATRHPAELILHDQKQERFLCKKCAALELPPNPVLLAKAVIEMYLQ